MANRVLRQQPNLRNSTELYMPGPGSDGQVSPGSAASGCVYEGKEFRSPVKSEKVFERFHTGLHVKKLRSQSKNLYDNTPGQNRKVDCEKELYDDFRVRFGLEKPENTNMLFSPEADFRRR